MNQMAFTIDFCGLLLGNLAVIACLKLPDCCRCNELNEGPAWRRPSSEKKSLETTAAEAVLAAHSWLVGARIGSEESSPLIHVGFHVYRSAAIRSIL